MRMLPIRNQDARFPAALKVRHGWETQLTSYEQATQLSENFFMYFVGKRHDTAGTPPTNYDPKEIVSDWRMRDRLKTVSAVLAVCLNVGVDPPDIVKTNPCARLEAWVDPIPSDGTSQNQSNNNAQIGKNLQAQYENSSLRTRYKVILDPTIEELRKQTTALRKNAHNERILFHYNGHGVPKPTPSGEVWCFNKNYTQYIPIGLYDLQEWVSAPGLWVWDCSSAGGIVKGFLDTTEKRIAKQQDDLMREADNAQPQQPITKWEDCIHLAACRQGEVLPTNPDLPADLFTSCLTTPILMAVRFFILQNPLPSTSQVTMKDALEIPGKISERRTPLGELNWIFTAITDTIAWNCLEKPIFKKLFRQDLMVAALFRNFLLAQRVMRVYHCRAQSYPEITPTHDHPLWRSWDLAVEMILAQLPKLQEQQKLKAAENPDAPVSGGPSPARELEYVHSDFFADQLSAFEIYLSFAPGYARAHGYAKPPEQLPIVLQVLLSQVHRLRALILLAKFLDLGPWAVNLALSIGIFPYVLKLLQSQALDLKAPMIFIWTRILAVDQSCQSDLIKDSGYTYFTNVLNTVAGLPTANLADNPASHADHRAMCAFVIGTFCKGFRHGKEAVLASNPGIIENCLVHLKDTENPQLRQFSCLCLGHLIKDYPAAKQAALNHKAPARIGDRSHDPVPEVRAATLYALTSLVDTGDIDSRTALEEETLASIVMSMGMDGSIMVRRELTIFYSAFIKRYEKRILVAAWEQLLEERQKKTGVGDEPDLPSHYGGPKALPSRNGVANGSQPSTASRTRQIQLPMSNGATSARGNGATPSGTLSKNTIYRAVWRQVLSMSADPHQEVARNAGIIVDYVIAALLASSLGGYANEILDDLFLHDANRKGDIVLGDGISRRRSRDLGRPETPPSPGSTISKSDGYFAMSRTASVAAAMKNLVGWGPRSMSGARPPSPPSSPAGSMRAERPYRSRPLLPSDAALLLPPDALDKVSGPPHQPKAKEPLPPNYAPRDYTKAPSLPLASSFFTWSASYFREPQMRATEAEEPGSVSYNERLWRRVKNDKVIGCTQPLKESAGSSKWDIPCGYFGIGAAPVKMIFHQFEDQLITSDARDSIAVWDWKKSRQLCRFSNGNPSGSRVTELRFINEDDQAMLMTGSSDGVIKIFKNYDDLENIQLATSFRALNDLVVSDQRNAGLVFDWQQGQGRILVAGDERVIRVWQAGHELCVADIPARSRSCITSLTSDQVEGNFFVAGFGNGSVRAYDQRLEPRECMVMDWVNRQTDHKSWVVGVHLQRGGQRELISAESNGGIRLWDMRMRKSLASLDTGRKQARSLRSLSVHEHAPVFATGGADHTIRVYNTRLEHLSTSEPYMSYLRTAVMQRHAPITATAFHPHRMMLACGAINDGHVNLFRCDVVEEKAVPILKRHERPFRTAAPVHTATGEQVLYTPAPLHEIPGAAFPKEFRA